MNPSPSTLFFCVCWCWQALIMIQFLIIGNLLDARQLRTSVALIFCTMLAALVVGALDYIKRARMARAYQGEAI